MVSAKKQLTDQATKELAERLKQKITTADYRPGQWLKQIDIEKTFGVNRFTVRSAFAELTAGGFLEHIPYRGHRVVEHSIQERRLLTEAREIVETAAATKVMSDIDAAGIERLQQLAEAFQKALDSGDRPAMIETNFAFHRCFYHYCNNAYLSEQIDDMRERGVGSANHAWNAQTAISKSCQDHFDMVQALRDKNLVRLQSLIHIHLNRWQMPD